LEILGEWQGLSFQLREDLLQRRGFHIAILHQHCRLRRGSCQRPSRWEINMWSIVLGGMSPRRCLLGKRCLPNTPLQHVYKWDSHIAIKQEIHLLHSFVSLLSILQHVINT
jgi:hypothetical protein